MNDKLYKITKLRSVDNPYHQNSTFGESMPFHVGIFTGSPVIGKRFVLFAISDKQGFRGISTSPVTKLIDNNTFETLNSVYKYEPYEGNKQ